MQKIPPNFTVLFTVGKKSWKYFTFFGENLCAMQKNCEFLRNFLHKNMHCKKYRKNLWKKLWNNKRKKVRAPSSDKFHLIICEFSKIPPLHSHHPTHPPYLTVPQLEFKPSNLGKEIFYYSTNYSNNQIFPNYVSLSMLTHYLLYHDPIWPNRKDSTFHWKPKACGISRFHRHIQ